MESAIEVTEPTGRCPWCDSPISRTKFLEIEQRIRAEEQKKAQTLTASLHERFRKDLAAARQIAAKDARAAGLKVLAKVVAARDAAVKQAARLKAQAVQLRRQVFAAAERRQQGELVKQRHLLEREHQQAMRKLRADFARDKGATQKKVADLERQLQKRTAHELGDGAELDLFEALRDAFPGDHVSRVRKGEAGADIHHEVFHHGQSCGVIAIDSKNHKAWQNAFVSKLRRDQAEAGAHHAILATTVFPSGERELCLRDDVILITPARTPFIVQLLRSSMVRMHVQGLSLEERNAKVGRLYAYITSEACSRRFREATKITDDLSALDVQETRDHQKVWAQRGRTTTRLKTVLRELDAEIAAIVEGADVRPG